MHNTGNRAVGIFGEWILRESILFEFFAIRDTLEPDGIAWVTDQAEVVRVDANVEELVQALCKLTIKSKPLHQILPAIHTLSKHFLPEFHVCLSSSVK